MNLPPSLAYSGLATGGSAMKAVEVLKEHGVPEERMIFINLVATFVRGTFVALTSCKIAAPEGLQAFCTKFPALRVV